MPIEGTGVAISGLGGAVGYGEIEVPPGDDDSFQVDLSAVFADGINWFGTMVSAETVFVNVNGTVSFGTAYGAPPTDANAAPEQHLIAPFWGDVDTRLDGEAPESGSIYVDIDPASSVVSVTWHRVGVYRRNAEDLNTFQLQLYDRGGGDFDIVFRYQRVDWTQGTAPDDIGAQIGLSATSEPWITPQNLPDLEMLPSQLGNTGQPGLWVFEMRAGVLTHGVTQGDDITGTDASEILRGTPRQDSLLGEGGDDTLIAGEGDDFVFGGADNDSIEGQGGDDSLDGGSGRDTISGGDGTDTLIGDTGDDFLYGGATSEDRRDVIYAGAGNDVVDGGYGNDELRGDQGNDTLTGGFGSDTVIGGTGQDALNGAALSDVLFGGDGQDFINGGFGYDRVNGGLGGDSFYHLGIYDHGSDWIQDFNSTEGDHLVFGDRTATGAAFQLNYANTPGAGHDSISEVFVIYGPTGQIIWALVDGAAQSSISLHIGSATFDLLA